MTTFRTVHFLATVASMTLVLLIPTASQAEVLKYACTSQDVGGQKTAPYLVVDTESKKVSFPKGEPPQTAPVEVTAGEISYVTPYGFYEVKIDRRSGLVLTRTNKRIWVENGTCTLDKGA